MADVTVVYDQGDVALPASLGQWGFHSIKIQHDGSGVSFPITLPTSSTIKTIRGCIGQYYSHNIPNAGVNAQTGFTVKFAAGTNLTFLDILVFGEGR